MSRLRRLTIWLDLPMLCTVLILKTFGCFSTPLDGRALARVTCSTVLVLHGFALHLETVALVRA